jgi:predicted acetyltransferase
MELRHPSSTRDRDQTYEILRRAFNMDVEREKWDPANPNEMLWQLYEGDDLLATSKVHDWGQWLGGGCVPTAGISGVGVAPQHRGRGHASALFHRLLNALRDEGFASTGLMPASTALYRGVGYEVASVWSERRVPTRALRDLPRATHITVRYATADDIDAMRACHERIAPQRDGWMRMSDQWWGSFRSMFDDGYGYAAVDGDEVLGYVWYRHEKDPLWGFGISLEAVIADDVDVYCALWQTIASSSTMVHHVRARNLPPENPLLLLMPEQDMDPGLELRYMARLLDVPAAMSARGFPLGLDAQVDIVVDDPIVVANAGRWRLSVHDGKGSAEPGGDGTATLDIGALSSLFTGWATPHTLRLAGRLRGGTDDDLASLKAMFAGPTPSLQLFF